MANEVIARLTRTMQAFFRIGNIRIKDSAGTVQLRSGDDSAYADLAAQKLRVQSGNPINAVVLTSPNALGTDVTLTLPGTAGSSGQLLRTNGSGILSWEDAQSGANLVESTAFSDSSVSPLTVLSAPPAGTQILGIRIEVVSPAGGGSPTLSIGTASAQDAYVVVGDNDLTSAGFYIINDAYELSGGDNIIATITPDSQTFSGNIHIIYSTPS